MAIVQIEGKEITLPDDVVKAGTEAVRAVLAASGFPAVENAHIVLPDQPGAPAVVTPRPTGKGNLTGGRADFINALINSPAYINPAIELAALAMRAESDGDTGFIERAERGGDIERAVSEGMREGKNVIRAMRAFGHCVPCSSKEVPVGF